MPYIEREGGGSEVCELIDGRPVSASCPLICSAPEFRSATTVTRPRPVVPEIRADGPNPQLRNYGARRLVWGIAINGSDGANAGTVRTTIV